MTEPSRVATVPTEGLWAIRPELLPAIAAAMRANADTPPPTDGEAEAGPLAIRSGGGTSGVAVAVIPVAGVITKRVSLFALLFGGGGSTLGTLQKRLRAAVNDDQVGAIVLEVDSPGGSVDGVPELAAEIRAARSRKPIIAVANARAASAAYWLASQASELFVSPSGAVGSVGVFVAHEDWSAFDERLGVTTTLVSAGKYKTEANPHEPLSDEARAAIQADVDAYYGMFVADVAKGRGVKASAVRSGFGEGRMVLAADAVAAGMADAVGTVDDAVTRAARLAAGAGSPRRADADLPAPEAGDVDTPTPEAAPAGPDPEAVFAAGWARDLIRDQEQDAAI